MPFEFDTPFLEIDPTCVPKFARTFEHVEWIDGESIVQAEETATEQGFNTRFRKIIEDLDALAEDARRGLSCTAAMRASVFDIIAEAEAELDRLGTPVETWTTPTLLNGWHAAEAVGPGAGGDFNEPGYFRDLSGVVHLRGIADGGPVPGITNLFRSVLFHLPPGYRPELQMVLHCQAFGQQLCRLDISASGDVILRTEYTSWISLDGLSFRRSTRPPEITLPLSPPSAPPPQG